MSFHRPRIAEHPVLFVLSEVNKICSQFVKFIRLVATYFDCRTISRVFSQTRSHRVPTPGARSHQKEASPQKRPLNAPKCEVARSNRAHPPGASTWAFSLGPNQMPLFSATSAPDEIESTRWEKAIVIPRATYYERLRQKTCTHLDGGIESSFGRHSERMNLSRCGPRSKTAARRWRGIIA